MICFEQELLRAHERVSRTPTEPTLSVCSVLIEKNFPSSQSLAKSDIKLDESEVKDDRLLTSYIQDVWDKFHRESVLLANRHRCEVESLWLLQRHHWTKRQKETGKEYMGGPVFNISPPRGPILLN